MQQIGFAARAFAILAVLAVGGCSKSSDSGGVVPPTGGGGDPSFTILQQADASINAVALAADGSGDVYVGVGAPGIVRLNSNGTIDAGFVTGTGFASTPMALAAEAGGTGDVYVAGTFSSYDGNASNMIIRINANGSVDAGFAVGTGFNS